MSTLPYERALVTGASTGIGAATSRVLAAEGLEVLAVARREERLAALAAETGCRILAVDIRAADAMADAIADFKPQVVVNNAGVGHGITGLGGVDAGDIAEAIAINVTAPIQITAAAVAVMKREGLRGHVVNMGSISGLHTLVSSLYGAGKAAVHGFSQTLRVEVKGFPIRVTEICPGRVSSEFYDAAKGDKATLAKMASTGISELRPDDIASAILFALKAPLHVNISTIELLPTEQAVGGAMATPIPQL